MTENDIKGNFIVLRDMAAKVAGADLPSAERETIKLAVELSLRLLEGFLLDVNRISGALEAICIDYQNSLRH